MKWSHLWLVFLLVLAGACGKRGGGSKSSKKVKLTPAQMEAIMADQDLSCPSGDCPDAIARLFIVNFQDAEESAMCSGSLVGPRLLLTNSHCVEHGTLSKACAGFYAVFHTRAAGNQIARCKQILFRHDNPQRSARGLSFQDYALVELDRDVNVRPLTIDRQGFSDHDIIHPYVVDHVSLNEARIVKLACRVLTGEGVTPRDKAFGGCPVIGGNSGSPILNSRGDVTGVVFAASPTEANEETAYPRRATLDGYGFGFSMEKILEDLDQWL